MKLLSKILRLAGLIWFLSVSVAIGVGIIRLFQQTDGLAEVWWEFVSVESPFNAWDFVIAATLMVPSAMCRYVSRKLEGKAEARERAGRGTVRSGDSKP